MKNILGLSLVVVGGGAIAYTLFSKKKKITFADNESLQCERLAYEKEKASGDWLGFNRNNPNPTIEQARKIASGDKKEISYWQGINEQRQKLSDAYSIAESNFAKAFCELKEKKQDLVDCSVLTENIFDYKEKISNLQKDPESNRENSSVSGDIRYYKDLLEKNQKAYDSNNCILNTNTQVSVSNTSFQKCASFDASIKEIKQTILDLSKKALTTSGLSKNEEILLSRWQEELNEKENSFTNLNCRDKVETRRLTDSAIVSTKLAEQVENQVLGKNEKERYVYLGAGGLVLLTGLFIILKK